MGEFLIFEFNDHMTVQNTIIKDKVGIEIFIIDDNTLLTRLEAKALAKFKQEFLKMVDESILYIFFVDDFFCF